MVQVPPAGTELPQLSVSWKSPLLVMDTILSGTLPVLVSMTGLGALVEPRLQLLKLKLETDKLTPGYPPNPPRPTVCGLPLALSVTTSNPLSLLALAGLRVTLIVQLAPVGTEPPQLFDWLKATEVVAMLEIASGAPPVFVKVTS